jgi:hypothetical protein
MAVWTKAESAEMSASATQNTPIEGLEMVRRRLGMI